VALSFIIESSRDAAVGRLMVSDGGVNISGILTLKVAASMVVW
jgi:hypothetical protein